MFLTIYNGFVLRDYSNLESRHHQLLIVIMFVRFCCLLVQNYAFIFIRKTFSSFFFKEIFFSVILLGKRLETEHNQTQHGVFANVTCYVAQLNVPRLQSYSATFGF